MNIARMKLSVKLIGGFLVVAVVTLVVGFIGMAGIRAADDLAEKVSLSKLLAEREIDHLNWVLKVGAFQNDESLTKLDVEKDEHKCGFGRWYYSEDRQRVAAGFPAIADYLKSIEEPHRKLHQTATALETILQKGTESRPEAVRFYRAEVLVTLKEVQQNLGNLRRSVDHTLSESGKSASRASLFSVVGMIAGFLIAVTLGILLSRSITGPIGRVATGLKDRSEQVASAASQVTAASQHLAEGSSEQASSLEETSSSLEEMASMTKGNAANANQAKAMMQETTEIVAKVDRQMNEMSAAIDEITRSSEETGKIIKTIDEIAFQTNLLALNAAVEAARAGEAGAGFAVVADEVRNLALRAAEAARTTGGLIENTIKSVKQGNELTQATREAFKANVANAGKVAQLIEEIAAASNEQAQGIDQINKAISEMDKVTQQTAASAQESTSASEELTAQAEQMKGFVSELEAVIGGQRGGNGATGRSAPVTVRAAGAAVRRPPIAGPSAETSRKRPAAAPQRRGPEQIIPLDDEGFKDF